MTGRFITEYVAGVSFGAALFASGVYSPAVISAQLNLESFHMIKSFMTASAVSAVVMCIADRTAYASMKVKVPQNLGFFNYDGNIIGGILIGIGMALTGACPGTVLVQSGISGMDSGKYALLGGILGGLAYVLASPSLQKMKQSLQQHSGDTVCCSARTVVLTGARPGSPTIHASLNINPITILVGWEAICLIVLTLVSAFDPSHGQGQLAGLTSPILGGLAIGAAQAIVVLLTRHSVGCSKAYENFGRYLDCIVKSGEYSTSAIHHLSQPSVIFALGIISVGKVLASIYPPSSIDSIEGSTAVAKALFGGAAMAVGASIAGGCTSGHGISGLVTFSFASFISVAAMFGAGIAASLLIG